MVDSSGLTPRSVESLTSSVLGVLGRIELLTTSSPRGLLISSPESDMARRRCSGGRVETQSQTLLCVGAKVMIGNRLCAF